MHNPACGNSFQTVSGKSLLMLFAPTFDHFGCDVARAFLANSGGGRVHGLCTGAHEVHEHVAAELGEFGGQFWRLEDEERTWLATPASSEELEAIERDLGPGAFGRIVIADRRVGRGFVRGGLTRPDRIGRTVERNPATAAQRYVNGLYRFLQIVLQETEPSVVFCYAVAGAPAVALAELCRVRSIPFCKLTPTRIGDKYIVDSDAAGRQACVAHRFERARDGSEPFSPTALEEAKCRLELFRKRPVQPGYVRRTAQPWLLRALIRLPLYCLKSLARGRRPGLGLKAERAAFRLWIAWRRKFVGRAWFSTPDDLPSSFIYFPLHVDPEASTMVLSPWHTDQIAVIEALAMAVPAHMRTVVKEHAPMLGRRPRGFYRQLAHMPRVTLLGPDHSTFHLIERAALTVVITGTAAWEALLLGKPVLIVGDSPFLIIGEGLVHEPDLTRLPLAISAALRLPPASDRTLALYIAAAESESFEMPRSLLWGIYLRHPEDERRRVVAMIADRIFGHVTATDNSELHFGAAHAGRSAPGRAV